MLVYKVRDYIKSRQVVSLKELSLHFDVSEPAMEGMVSLWLARGEISPYKMLPCKGSCDKNCSSSTHYQYAL